MTESSERRFLLYSGYEWRMGAALAAAIVALSAASSHFVPVSAFLFPAAAIALGGLFLWGARLWPFAYIALLAAGALADERGALLAILPFALVMQAWLGAKALRAVRLDPLFRRYRDAFYFLSTAALVALILPGASALAAIFLHAPYSLAAWEREYFAAAFILILVTPLMLRWCAKPRFSRRPGETAETVVAFAVLLAANYALFAGQVATFYGIPFIYFLLVPLFWIALRMRPRFLTLAVVITSTFAISATVVYAPAALLDARLFSLELFLIVIGVVFYIVMSLEEDRRVNMNLMRSQLSTLENAVVRVSTESSAKNDFIAILAHELRNPLAPVVSAIDLLKMKGAHDEEERELFDMMEDRMRVVRRLLDDLLDISRVAEGKIALKREAVDIAAVARRALLTTEHFRHERHQSLKCELPEDPLSVAGDSVRIEQIFSNLLTNASKYSNPGDQVSFSMRKDGAAAVVEVADEGVGIDTRSLESVFMPFHQLEHGERSKKGLGIGLALVKSFAEMHDGTVIAESDGPNTGSRFVVRLPLLETQPKETGEQQAAAPLPPRSSALRVLIVDDNDAAAAGIGRLLEMRGCSVAYAYDGGQAIKRALGTRPDVVLLDVGLPDQDGYNVAKTLRARGFTGRLIALSGYSTGEAKRRAATAGFEHYVVKPAGFEELRRVIPEIG